MTSIEWTDRTWNPVRGCSRVSEGCRNCYAEKIAARFVNGPFWRFAERGKWTGRVELIHEKLDEPLRWRKAQRVFVNSMSDLFHEGLPFEDIAAVFGVMAACPGHTFQVLTKRPVRMLEFFEWYDADRNKGRRRHPELIEHAAVRARSDRLFRAANEARGDAWPLPNVWLGVSVEDQATADERIPLLLQTPAARYIVSQEPLLSYVAHRDEWLLGECHTCGARAGRHYRGPCECGGVVVGLDQVIVGGESGPGARPCNVEWMRSARDQCAEAGVAFFCKQLGSKPRVFTGRIRLQPIKLDDSKGGDMSEWPEDLRVREMPE